MKKSIYISTLIILCSLSVRSQKASVEKSITGIQIGYLGIWLQNEAKLSSKIAFRSEIGLDAGVWASQFYPKAGFVLIPVVTLEPKWYYNLDKRLNNSKNIANNSGNFISIQASYHPRWFHISNYDNVKTYNQFSIIPTYGLKRKVGNHFTFETGLGYGLSVVSKNYEDIVNIEIDPAINLHLRLGYIF